MSIEIREPNDIKVFILYILNNIGTPLDFDTFSEIIFTVDFVKHFDFAEYFGDLLDNGLISESSDGKIKTYTISPKGKIALDGVGDRLLNLIKEKALLAANRFLEYKENGLIISSRIVPIDDNKDSGVMLYCVIKDKVRTYLNLETYVANKISAEKMKIVFESRAEKLCSQFQALMSEDITLL